MNRTIALLSCASWIACATACGGSEPSVAPPDVEEFDVDPMVRAEVDQVAMRGEGAEGSYAYDPMAEVLTVTLTASTFSCGIEAGALVATVVELTPTRMVWTFEDGGDVTWTRVDNGTEGVAGIWSTDDPMLFLILSADGSASIFGDEMACDEDRRRNDQGCYELGLSGASITLDGNTSDWDDVNESATLRDEAGDASSEDPGADIRAIKVEHEGDALYVLLELADAPSTAFHGRRAPNGGAYRLTVQGDNGLSAEQRVAYSPDTEEWVPIGTPGQVTVAVGATAIEWRVDLSSVSGEGFERVDLILVQAIDCGAGTCESLDDVSCGFYDVP